MRRELLKDRVCVSLSVLVATFVAFHSVSASAQASLAADDIVDEVPVDLPGGKDSFTLIRDGREREQWYYIPDRPRLVVKSGSAASSDVPEFTLLRYQFPSDNNSESLAEGGLLQFAATLAAPPGAIEQMKTALRASGVSGPIRLSALPLKSAEVALYTPTTDSTSPARLVSSSPQGTGIAPTYATQKMVFSVPLSRSGTDFMEALANSATGVPVAVTFTYNGLTPKAGFTVTVNWDQSFSHYSSDETFRAEASYYGLFGASYQSNSKHLMESLLQHKDITIDIIPGESFNMADADKYLQPILARINAEILAGFKPPPDIVPAQAKAPTAGGFFGSAGYSVSRQDVHQIRHGTEIFSMNVQSVVERKTVASGFIGIGAFPKAVREQVVTVVPPGPIKSAYLALPAVAGLDEMGITQIDLEATLRDPIATTDWVKASDTQLVKWTPSVGWHGHTQQPRSAIVFGLLDRSLSKQAYFDIKLHVTTTKDVLSLSRKVPAFTGDKAISAINESAIDAVRIDASSLCWKALSAGCQLRQVQLTLKANGKTVSGSIQPKLVNGTWLLPSAFVWLVEHKDTPAPVTATIQAKTDKAVTQTWSYSGQDLRAINLGLDVMLFDSDFHAQ